MKKLYRITIGGFKEVIITPEQTIKHPDKEDEIVPAVLGDKVQVNELRELKVLATDVQDALKKVALGEDEFVESVYKISDVDSE